MITAKKYKSFKQIKASQATILHMRKTYFNNYQDNNPEIASNELRSIDVIAQMPSTFITRHYTYE